MAFQLIRTVGRRGRHTHRQERREPGHQAGCGAARASSADGQLCGWGAGRRGARGPRASDQVCWMKRGAGWTSHGVNLKELPRLCPGWGQSSQHGHAAAQTRRHAS